MGRDCERRYWGWSFLGLVLFSVDNIISRLQFSQRWTQAFYHPSSTFPIFWVFLRLHEAVTIAAFPFTFSAKRGAFKNLWPPKRGTEKTKGPWGRTSHCFVGLLPAFSSEAPMRALLPGVHGASRDCAQIRSDGKLSLYQQEQRGWSFSFLSPALLTGGAWGCLQGFWPWGKGFSWVLAGRATVLAWPVPASLHSARCHLDLEFHSATLC